MKLRYVVSIFTIFLWLSQTPALADDTSTTSPFLPTWKLMNTQQKRQFIAGYLQGWKDAELITDIAIKYVKENPTTAVGSLERLKTLYDMSALRPDSMVSAIDHYFSEPENSDGTLSKAVTFAKVYSQTPHQQEQR